MSLRYVNVYDHNRAYGGPEEGGWWFDTGEPLASVPVISDEEKESAKKRLQEIFGALFAGNHDINSVLCEGALQILVEDHPARAYPQYKPHYE